MTGVSTLYYSTASNADSMSQDAALGEREQSLLHTKLYEKNASLRGKRGPSKYAAAAEVEKDSFSINRSAEYQYPVPLAKGSYYEYSCTSCV